MLARNFTHRCLNYLRKIKRNINFIRENRKFWSKKVSNFESEDFTLVEISEFNPLELESNTRVAKAFEEKLGTKTVVFSSSRTVFFSWYAAFCKSYCVEKIVRFTYISPSYYIILISTLLSSVSVFRKLELSKLDKLEFDGIIIGDLIYDTYLRFNDGKYSVCKDMSLFKFIFSAIRRLNESSRIIESYNAKILVTADKCYIDHGVLYRTAIYKGLKVVLVAKQLKLIEKHNEHVHLYHPELDIKDMENILSKEGIDLNRTINEYFAERFSGKIDQIDVISSYKDKRYYSRNDIINSLELDQGKKNVVIMPHAFSDFPHIAKGLYKDYYVWLRSLLEMTKNIQTVNWLVKPHPTSYHFGEVGEVENIIIELGCTNVHVIPSDFNTASLEDCADVILTVRGTAGLEFSTFGIPVITAGEGPYSGYGIDLASKSVFEYESRISNIKDCVRLGGDAIYRAKLVFYFSFIRPWARPCYLDNMQTLSDFNDALIYITQFNLSNDDDNLMSLAYELIERELTCS